MEDMMAKYSHYKKQCDYHMGMCNKYKGYSKRKYMMHYKYYKYYYAKMMVYGQKCGHGYGHGHADNVCETHTYYKHYYHHDHIDIHRHRCEKDDSCGC